MGIFAQQHGPFNADVPTLQGRRGNRPNQLLCSVVPATSIIPFSSLGVPRRGMIDCNQMFLLLFSKRLRSIHRYIAGFRKALASIEPLGALSTSFPPLRSAFGTQNPIQVDEYTTSRTFASIPRWQRTAVCCRAIPVAAVRMDGVE